MLRSECSAKQIVVFGRPNGEQTIGEVVKCNPAKAKIKTLENRGLFGQRPVGQVWVVPYTLIRPATADEIKSVGRIPAPAVVRPGPIQNENEVMQAIADCYLALSPENLSCDGELSQREIIGRRADIMRRLGKLQDQIGRIVSETEALRWALTKRSA